MCSNGAAGILGSSYQSGLQPHQAPGPTRSSIPEDRVREIPALVTLAFGKVGILVSESIAKPAPASTEFTEVHGVTPAGTVCQICPDSLGSSEDRCESAVALETPFLRREAWSGEDGNWGAGAYFGVLGRRKTKSYMEELSKADQPGRP